MIITDRFHFMRQGYSVLDRLRREVQNNLKKSERLLLKRSKKLLWLAPSKEQFPNEDALESFLVSQFLDYNYKFGIHCYRGVDRAKPEISQMFESLEAKA